jgi:hypothetical protein
MLLLTFEEWLGPGREHPDRESVNERTRMVAFATDLKLLGALSKIAAYQDAYNRHFSLAVNFRLLSVQEIDRLDSGTLECVGVEMIESLKESFGD